MCIHQASRPQSVSYYGRGGDSSGLVGLRLNTICVEGVQQAFYVLPIPHADGCTVAVRGVLHVQLQTAPSRSDLRISPNLPYLSHTNPRLPHEWRWTVAILRTKLPGNSGEVAMVASACFGFTDNAKMSLVPKILDPLKIRRLAQMLQKPGLACS